MSITLGLFSALLMIIPRFPRMGLCKSLFFDYCVAILGIDVFLILYHKIANLSIIKWQKGAAEATPQNSYFFSFYIRICFIRIRI